VIKPKISYIIDTKSDFLFNLVKNYILEINQQVNVFDRVSLLGSYIVVSDSELPSYIGKRKKYIIRRQPHHSKDFTKIDLDDQIFVILSEIYQTQDKELISYCNQSRIINNMPVDDKYTVFVILKESGYDADGNFNRTIADNLINKNYKIKYPLKEKYRVIITFISEPTFDKLGELVSVFYYENDTSSVVNIVTSIVEGTIPEYINKNYGQLMSNQHFIKNLLKISVFLLKSSNIEEFLLKLRWTI